MSEFDLLRTAAAGMDAQRAALDLAARNVAASEADGPTFERLVPRYALAPSPGDAATPDGYEPEDPSDDDPDGTGGRYVARVPGKALCCGPRRTRKFARNCIHAARIPAVHERHIDAR